MKGDKKITLTEKDSASQSLWTGKSPGYPGQDLFQKRKYQYGRIT